MVYINDFERGFILGLNIGQQNSPYFRMIVLSESYEQTVITPNLDISIGEFNEELLVMPFEYNDNGLTETYTPQAINPNLTIGIISFNDTVSLVKK